MELFFYDQNYLTVSYIGVSHSIPEKVSYKYMLRGVDRQWQLNGYSRTVNYENLAPGEYTFLVKACNSDGILQCNISLRSKKFY